MSKHVFYVIATEGDMDTDAFGNAVGDPIIFETSMNHATIDDARRRASSMNGRYGKTIILECKPVEEYVEFK